VAILDPRFKQEASDLFGYVWIEALCCAVPYVIALLPFGDTAPISPLFRWGVIGAIALVGALILRWMVKLGEREGRTFGKVL
jgi:uncharacterized RDD family membrane protein YckC